MKPLTTLTPSFCAARAVSFISWIAHSVFFLASPRTAAGTQSSVRESLWSSTSWPVRWFEIAQHFSPYLPSRS